MSVPISDARANSAFARLVSRANKGTIKDLPDIGTLPTDVGMVKRGKRADMVESKAMSVQKAQKKKQGVKAEGAWKYVNNEIVRAPTTVLNNRRYTDPKSDEGEMWIEEQGEAAVDDGTHPGKPRRHQESNFFITINPNKSYDEREESAAANRFKAVLKYLHKSENMQKYVMFGGGTRKGIRPVKGGRYYQKDQFSDVIIANAIDFRAGVEVGEKLGRMHCHVLLYFEHYSQVMIDIPMLKAEFKLAWNETLPPNDEKFMSTPPYVRVDLLPQTGATEIVRRYLKKSMVG